MTRVVRLFTALAAITAWHPSNAQDSMRARERPTIAIENVAVVDETDEAINLIEKLLHPSRQLQRRLC